MIEVRCVCGKSYTVPDDKAGKKLQCKRCGSVTRIPRTSSGDDVVVPFQDPGVSADDDDAFDLLSTAPTAPAPLEIRDPLRRCPSCGLQDEVSIVVCVRCGYDFRKGRRLEDAHEQGERSARLRVTEDAEAELQRLVGMAWLALSPLGVALGPYLIARSYALEPHARLLGREARALDRVRGIAVTGLVLWLLGLGALGVALTRRGRPEQERLDRDCRARLERVGGKLRARVAADRRFPAAGAAWSAALEELAGQGSADLRCPVGADLWPFRRREAEVLTPQTAEDYVVLWDPEPHPDASGVAVLRALRADGRLETYRRRADLDRAVARPAFPPVSAGGGGAPAGGAGGTPPATTTSPRPATDGGGAGDPQRARVAMEAFLAFAGGVDDGDPDFTQGVTVDPEFFTDRVGIPHDDLLPGLLAGPDPHLRTQAARMLARLTLPRELALRRARSVLEDPVPEVRLGAALCLKRHGDPAWLDVMAGVVEDAVVEETRRVALAWLGREALQDQAGARAVLLAAAALRRRTGSSPDAVDAVLPLPDGALEHAVALLEDKDRAVRREAGAALFSAGEAGVRVLLPVLAPERSREVRHAAFQVLDRLRAAGAISLEDYLQRVTDELDPDVRADAVTTLARDAGPPPMPLLDWALEALRRTPPTATRMRPLCDAVLDRAGRGPAGAPALQRMLDDLSRDGSARPVLEALGRGPARVLDERIDDMLARRWEKIPDPANRILAVRFLADRPHEASLRALLVGVADPVEEVRIEALRGLKDATAVRSADFRREAARVMGQRLRAEESPRALEVLYVMAGSGAFCEGTDGNEHRCATPLIRALEQLVRKGERGALRAMRGHPTEKVLDFLVSALEAARDEPSRQDVVGSLQTLTGVNMSWRDGAEWRKLVAPPTPQVSQILANIIEDEARRLKNVEERAQQRLEDLRQKAAAER